VVGNGSGSSGFMPRSGLSVSHVQSADRKLLLLVEINASRGIQSAA